MAAAGGLSRVQAHLFGPLSVKIGAHTLGPRDFGGIKPKQLLEILLARRGRTVDKATLADLLWSERPPRHPAAAVEHCVSLVRHALSRDNAGTGRRLVVTERAGYRFPTGEATVDLDRFDQMMATVSALRTPAARRQLAAALALADRGDVLEDERHARWAEPLRATYRARLLTARLEASEAALVDGDYNEAAAHALAALDLNAYEERSYRMLMLAQYAVGRQHDALTTYALLRSRLNNELGLEPTPQAAALQGAVLRQVDVRSLMPRRRHVALGQAPHVVPLLGRVDELAALEAVVDEALCGSTQLVLVSGPQGIGKTRLLDELVRRVPGVTTGRAVCLHLQRHLPYVSLASTLRDALGQRLRTVARHAELASILPELTPRRRHHSRRRLWVLEALVGLVRTHAPMVWTLDDFHWADHASVTALSYLVSRGAGLPLAIVAAVDPMRLSRASPIRSLNTSVVLPLEPLAPADLATLVAPDLYARTHGSPALITAELAQGGAATFGQSSMHPGPPPQGARSA